MPPIPHAEEMAIHVPPGDLVSSRVVSELSSLLGQVLDRERTGYLILDPQDTLLLDGNVRGVITVEDGIPVLAYEISADRTGTAALARLADPGPYQVECYATTETDLEPLHDADDTESFRIPPGAAAEELARDADLADRTREHASGHRFEESADGDPLSAFLSDTERIESIQAEARAEAKRRADQWDFTADLVDESTN